MNPNQHQRRRLLKGMGAAGLLAYAPFVAASSSPVPSPRLAVFLPRSGRYPTISDEYLAGLTVALIQHGLDADAMLPIAYGANPAVGIRQAQALLAREHMDVMTGVLCPTAALALEPALLSKGVPLLVNDTGANRMQSAAHSGIIIRQSLEYWQSCAAFGHWAPNQLGRRAVLAMGNLEYGYDFPGAFSDAFAASGGTVVATHVSDLPQADTEFSGLAAAIQEHQPDFVFALYSGPQAQRFLATYRASAWANKLPLASGGFLGADVTSGVTGPDWSVASWHAATATCSRFTAACDAGNLRVTPFSVLGYESGNRIATAWLAARSTSSAFVTALHAAPRTGPRARRQYHLASMESQGAHWIATAGTPHGSRVEASHSTVLTIQNPLAQYTAQQPQRGLVNPYLIT
ncbi:MAG: ABC transporter substrate-binding protein [Rhodoferax sp.]